MNKDLILVMAAVVASLFISAAVLYWLVQMIVFMWRLV